MRATSRTAPRLATLSAIVLAGLLAPPGVTPATAKVGIASVVNGEPLAKPPADNERVLHVGNDMTADEVVMTKAKDRAHLVFLDGSTLTIGPDTTVIIDKFVFDPAQQSGTLNLRASRGIFRYVGGAISKNAEVTIKTPSATLGIRGGIATVSIEPSGATRANFLFGASLSITSQGVTQVTTQPGTQISVLTGMAPTPPVPIPPGILQQASSSFAAPAGAAGPGGAASAGAVSTALSGSTLGQANSGLSPTAARSAIPATQQAQLAVGKAAAAAGTPNAQAAASQQAGPLQSAGPLQASGPNQGSGPLQNAGPLAAASPFQQTGPIATNAALSLGATQPGLPLPGAPVQQAALNTLAAGVAAGDGTALQQLQNILASPEGGNPAVLGTLVSGLVSTPPAAPPSTPAAAGPTGGGAPVPLAPTVYGSPASASVSPN